MAEFLTLPVENLHLVRGVPIYLYNLHWVFDARGAHVVGAPIHRS
jgi:hypothetical protein